MSDPNVLHAEIVNPDGSVGPISQECVPGWQNGAGAKPKRRWRMTKADYERVIADQAATVERTATLLAEARGQLWDVATKRDDLIRRLLRWRLACLALATACAVLGVW